MRQTTVDFLRTRAGRVGLLVLFPLAILACSKSTNGADGPNGTLQTLPTSTTQPVAGGARPKCDEPTLTPLVGAKYSGATIADLACNDTQAAMTVLGASDLKGDGVALIAMKNGVWVLVASDRVDADPNTLIPKDFAVATYDNWRRKYDAIHNPQAPTSPPSFVTDTVTEVDPNVACKVVNDMPCISTTSTTQEIIITTTTATTTPPTTPPSTDSPVSTTPPTTKGTSAFCKTHIDPRCIADPSFPG